MKLSKAMAKALVAMGEQVWTSLPMSGRKAWVSKSSTITIADTSVWALHERSLVRVMHHENRGMWWYEAQLTDAGRKLAAEIAANHIGEADDMVRT